MVRVEGADVCPSSGHVERGARGDDVAEDSGWGTTAAAGIISLPKLAVHLAAVTDARHDYDPSRVVYFVNDPVVPNADTKRLKTD